MSSNQASYLAGSVNVMLQNGVTGGSTDSLTQLDRSYSRSSNGRTDAFKVNTDRPKMLEVNPNKDFSAKHSRSGSAEVDDSSLPCTPEDRSDSEENEACSAEYEALAAETRSLVGRFLGEHSGIVKSRWTDGKALSTMKRVVSGLLEKHRYTYNGTFVFSPSLCWISASVSMKYKGSEA